MIIKLKKGFTLLEVMVALVIFSIGLLGLAGMQASGIRNNQVSYSRTYATGLVYDLADRIRTNPTASYNTIAASNGTVCVTDTGTCTPLVMAAYDLYEWNAAITDPASPLSTKNPVTFITPNLTTTGFIVSIGWDETGAGSPGSCNPPDPATASCVTINVEP